MASAVAIGVLTAVAGCGDDTPSSVIPPLNGHERPVIYEPGELVWAKRSTVHVGESTFTVAPQIVDELDWTPYGVFVDVSSDPSNGPFTNAFYDGKALNQIDDVYGEIVTSPDGELAAWIDRYGPERPAGPVAQVVVIEVRTGDVVFSSAEGMGGEKGDDIADRYEELTPAVVDLTAEEVVWINSEGVDRVVTTNLETGKSTTSEDWPHPATSGYDFTSPDGKYRVDASNTGRLKVRPKQPDFGHKWVTQGGWLGPHQMLVLGQDRFKWVFDPDVPDTIPGFILSCDLDAGTCRQLKKVVGARDVVFAGVSASY
jgi:hypothetical protein